MQLIDLSHTIHSDMNQWPGDAQPLKLHRKSEHGAGSHMSSTLEIGCHVGTHIDAPLHFLAGQAGIDALPLEGFCGAARVVRVGDGAAPRALTPDDLAGIELEAVDFVIFDTGWARHWGTSCYYEEWCWISPALAERLAAAGLKGVGLDTPSLDPFGVETAHDVCAAAGLINIENLTGLHRVPDGGWTLLVLPLKLAGTEASPVRAVGLLEAT